MLEAERAVAAFIPTFCFCWCILWNTRSPAITFEYTVDFWYIMVEYSMTLNTVRQLGCCSYFELTKDTNIELGDAFCKFCGLQVIDSVLYSSFIPQVRPTVEGDLLRLWSDTEAWQHHIKKRQEDEEAILQKPLFEVNTFTSKQVYLKYLALTRNSCAKQIKPNETNCVQILLNIVYTSWLFNYL